MPFPVSSISIYINPFLRYIRTKIHPDDVLLSIPCIQAFSTKVTTVSLGIIKSLHLLSISISYESLSPNLYFCISKYVLTSSVSLDTLANPSSPQSTYCLSNTASFSIMSAVSFSFLKTLCIRMLSSVLNRK